MNAGSTAFGLVWPQGRHALSAEERLAQQRREYAEEWLNVGAKDNKPSLVVHYLRFLPDLQHKLISR